MNYNINTLLSNEKTLSEKVSLGLDRELKRQKESGKEFVSDEEIDLLIDQVIKEELANKQVFNNGFSLDEVLRFAEYAYNFHKTTSFPDGSFEEYCKNNLLQYIQSLSHEPVHVEKVFTLDDMSRCHFHGWFQRERYDGPDKCGYEGKFPSNWDEMDYEEREQWFFEQFVASISHKPVK